MKYLVTGSAGLIGNQIVHDLEKSGEIVYSSYNNVKPVNGIPIKLNLLNLEDVSKIFKKFNLISLFILLHLLMLKNVK